MTAKNEKWQEDYLKLSCKDKEIIDRHVALSIRLNTWYKIRSHLLDEFHNKKFTLKRTRYQATDKETGEVYKMLYTGRRQLTSMDAFPCEFQNQLENVLCKEMGRREKDPIDLLCIYYGDRIIKIHKGDGWSLDKCEEMTTDDKEVINRFIEGLFSFFDEVIVLLTAHGKETALLHREKRRLSKHLIPLIV